MKKVLACALGIALLSMSTVAGAIDKDLSNWGNTGATPAPVKDDTRSGYWWWPTEPASNADDSEIWGNQGVVYHIYAAAPMDDKKPDVPTPPPTTAAPTPTRSVPVLSHVLFDFDKSTLKPEGKAVLDTIIGELKAHPGDTVVIQGHTCNVGEDAYNMGLGQRRADSVKKYLTDNGIDAARLSTVSLGETTPAVPNDSAANRKLNRRVQFEYTLNGQ